MAIEILKNAWLEKGKTILLPRNMSPPLLAFPPGGGGSVGGIMNYWIYINSKITDPSMNVNFNTTLFLGPSGFRVGGIPSCSSLLFPLRGDEGGVERIQNFHLEEKGEKRRDLALFQEAKEKKEGRGVPISSRQFYLFLKQTR